MLVTLQDRQQESDSLSSLKSVTSQLFQMLSPDSEDDTKNVSEDITNHNGWCSMQHCVGLCSYSFWHEWGFKI